MTDSFTTAKADRWIRQCLNGNQPKLARRSGQLTYALRLKASVRPWNRRRRPLRESISKVVESLRRRG